MAVGAGAAVAGDVLDDAADAARLEAVEQRPAQRRDPHRLAAERAVADQRVGARLRHVEQGQAIDVDPHFVRRTASASPFARAASIALIGAIS